MEFHPDIWCSSEIGWLSLYFKVVHEHIDNFCWGFLNLDFKDSNWLEIRLHKNYIINL